MSRSIVRRSAIQLFFTVLLVAAALVVMSESVAWGWVMFGLTVLDAVLGCGKILWRMKRGA